MHSIELQYRSLHISWVCRWRCCCRITHDFSRNLIFSMDEISLILHGSFRSEIWSLCLHKLNLKDFQYSACICSRNQIVRNLRSDANEAEKLSRLIAINNFSTRRDWFRTIFPKSSHLFRGKQCHLSLNYLTSDVERIKLDFHTVHNHRKVIRHDFVGHPWLKLFKRIKSGKEIFFVLLIQGALCTLLSHFIRWMFA